MKNPITQSASKLVFMLMTLALIVLTFRHIVEAKDFIVLASMSFTYYFTKPSEPKVVDNQDKNVLG